MLEDYEKNHSTEEDEVKREDRLALAALDAVMREFAAELRRNAPPSTTSTQRHPREQFGVVASGPKADEVLYLVFMLFYRLCRNRNLATVKFSRGPTKFVLIMNLLFAHFFYY